jgi:sulfite reductase (NADPH) flavoprotein alpha-component
VALTLEPCPLQPEQVELLSRLLPTLTPEQRQWLQSFLAASGEEADLLAGPAQGPGAPGGGLAVLFGSQTGNAERLAHELARRLRAAGHAPSLLALDAFEPRELTRHQVALLVVSTHGDGDPPDNAASFCEFWHSRRAPRLQGLSFAVLALGDRSYPRFCQTGQDLDRRLGELGAERLLPATLCDLDYEEEAEAWMASVLERLGKARAKAAPRAGRQVAAAEAQAVAYTRSRPFAAEVLESINLNGRGAGKETRHLELSLDGSGLAYVPGDALGIWPENPPALVAELLCALSWSPDQLVPVGKEGELPLGEALLRRYEITVVTRSLLEGALRLRPSRELERLLAPGREEELGAYLRGRDLLDLVRDLRLEGVPAPELLPCLRRLTPRLYSIASSPKAVPGEVHLTIRVVRYRAHGRDRSGVLSGQVAERVAVGDTLPVYVHPNPHFRLPADPRARLILIGAGTGVAPYRAFLQELAARGEAPPTWLFFGDWHFRTDFLYQVEWQRWLKEGVLTRLDVAFSRDGPRKVYVQDCLRARRRELLAWLADGAYIYVCGGEAMAAAVHTTLAEVVAEAEGLPAAAGARQLEAWRRQGRYRRDVY